jgi:ribonuclease HI
MRNMASVSWVFYSPERQLVSSGGVHLEPSTNNVVEYSVVIELLCDTISHGVQYLKVCLDSQLVVCQLNNSYRVRYPTLLQRFLWVRLLERYFDFLTYSHIPRISNQVFDAYANYILDWNLSHN